MPVESCMRCDSLLFTGAVDIREWTFPFQNSFEEHTFIMPEMWEVELWGAQHCIYVFIKLKLYQVRATTVVFYEDAHGRQWAWHLILATPSLPQLVHKPRISIPCFYHHMLTIIILFDVVFPSTLFFLSPLTSSVQTCMV